MSLQRNTAWIADLEDRELFISFDEDPKIGLMGLFGKQWHTLGIETEEGQWSLSRELTENTTRGAGFGVVSRHYKPGNLASSVDALEDNEVIDHIEWPSTLKSDSGVYGRIHDGKVARAHCARVHVKNDGTVHIQATREKAFLTIPERSRGDSAAGKTVNVAYLPDANKIVFEDRYFRVEGGEVVEFTPKRFVPDAQIDGTVADGTARQVGGGDGKEIVREDIFAEPQDP